MSKQRERKEPGAPDSAAEARVLAASIGTPKVLNDKVELVSYDPAWPSRFDQLSRQIRTALGNRVRCLEHVGSTSVPGLSAKPVIDMLLAVEDSSDEAAYLPPLEAAGFTLKIREPDWYEHRVLNPADVAANLHVFSVGCPEVERMLRFRDWLRSNPDDRALYERTKQELAARRWKYVQDYADAKGEVVGEILARAERTAAGGGGPAADD